MLTKGGKNSCSPLTLALHKSGTGKGTVVLVNAMKAYGEVEVQVRTFLTLALDAVSSVLNILAALYQKKSPHYPL